MWHDMILQGYNQAYYLYVVEVKQIMLVHPKCKFFLFSIAPCKFTAQNLLCFIFYVISLLLLLIALYIIVITLPTIKIEIAV